MTRATDGTNPFSEVQVTAFDDILAARDASSSQ